MQDGRELNDFEVNFDFDFKKTAQTFIRDIKQQTDIIETQAQETSTQKEVIDMECQTNPEEFQHPGQVSQFDVGALSQFLKKIHPAIMEALDESSQLQKLQTFKPLSETQNKNTNYLYLLENQENHAIEIERQLEITDIQWNSNGFMIAAAYGCLEHQGSCFHSSFLCVWNISKRDFEPSKPAITIETSTCLMCIQFHPRLQNIIAAGGFNGELFLYDLNTAQEIAHSTVDEYFHRECISQIIWLQDESILTFGCEGKILIWNPEYNQNQLQYPLKGCYLVRKKESQTESVGGLCIGQCKDDPYKFIVGSECGSVLKAQITPINYTMSRQQYLDSRDKGLIWKPEAILFMENLSQKYLPEIKSKVEQYCKDRKLQSISIQQIVNTKLDLRKMYANPLCFAFESHYGSVFSINFSSFNPSTFLTCSMDGQIRIYQSENARCLAVYEYAETYILSAQFSPVRPCVFAACDSFGQVLLFDLLEDHQQQILILKNEGLSTSNIRFNERQTDLLACALSGCQIKIYQLSDDLCRLKAGELEHFNKLLS